MNMTGNTILITGGASGIGLALAERFLQRENEVIICGRREDKLKAAQEKFPKLHMRVCDVSDEFDRQSLVEKKYATIINVSSGLAFVPPAWVPIYGATKAAVHSFTVSLRLSKSNINVVEVLPPAVNTDFWGSGMHTFGEPLDDFADAVFKGFEHGDLEIGYHFSEKVIRASRDEIDEIVLRNWERLQTHNV